jgi:hypothetical protein
VLSRNIVTFREDLGRSAPVPGRSNILSPECAGLITNLPPAARCCSRGRLHSVSVAASPRHVLVVAFSGMFSSEIKSVHFVGSGGTAGSIIQRPSARSSAT